MRVANLRAKRPIPVVVEAGQGVFLGPPSFGPFRGQGRLLKQAPPCPPAFRVGPTPNPKEPPTGPLWRDPDGGLEPSRENRFEVFTFAVLAAGNRFSFKRHHPLSPGEEREWFLSMKKEKLR
jgi:hypothetical protein